MLGERSKRLHILQLIRLLCKHVALNLTDAVLCVFVHQTGGAVGGRGTHYQPQTSLLSQQQRNPEEIDLDSDEDEEPPAASASAAVPTSAAAVNEEDDEDVEPGPGGALADGAPDSDEEGGADGKEGTAAAAAAGGGSGGGFMQQRPDKQLDDPMFGEVNTAQFPYYIKD